MERKKEKRTTMILRQRSEPVESSVFLLDGVFFLLLDSIVVRWKEKKNTLMLNEHVASAAVSQL